MFRIRQVHDDTTPANAAAVAQVQDILRRQFPALDREDVDKLPDMLRDPLKYRFRGVLLVGEDGQDRVRGFAFLLHTLDLNFSYLEYISAAP
jgi:hypothetical protein